jgi:hypothetical protein
MRTPGVVLEIGATQSRACASGKQPAKKLSMLARRLFVLAVLVHGDLHGVFRRRHDTGYARADA